VPRELGPWLTGGARQLISRADDDTRPKALSSPLRLSGTGVRSRVIVPCRRIGLRGTFEFFRAMASIRSS
jgi:hypothetical protein